MTESQRPAEAVLIDEARSALVPKMSGREAASKAGLSASYWAKIVRGDVVAPDDTLARMAKAVNATPTQLRAAGRTDAGDYLERLLDHERPTISVDSLATDESVRLQLEGIADGIANALGPVWQAAKDGQPGMREPAAALLAAAIDTLRLSVVLSLNTSHTQSLLRALNSQTELEQLLGVELPNLLEGVQGRQNDPSASDTADDAT